ncbi:hypothetical protein Dimus_004433 [Dionaea muscipula]
MLSSASIEEKAAERIETAVLETLDKGFRTRDIFSTGKTFKQQKACDNTCSCSLSIGILFQGSICKLSNT